MGVDVDKAGSDGFAAGVEGLSRVARGSAQSDNFTVFNTDITGVTWFATTIDEGAADNFNIVIHWVSLSFTSCFLEVLSC